jgi:hypothetical protein
MWWCTTIILALGRLRQEDGEIQANPGCIVRPCLKKKKEKKVTNYLFLVGWNTEGVVLFCFL